MRIRIHCPVSLEPARGNTVTARRWLRMFQDEGHETFLTTPRIAAGEERGGKGETEDPEAGPPAEVLVALHARRSHGVLRAFAEAHPEASRIVVLTGTDLYGDLPDDPEALDSLDLADRLVVLHDEARRDLPEAFRGKCRTILQSVAIPKSLEPAGPEAFELDGDRPGLLALVASHLREIKDPLLPARALARLPGELPIALRLCGELLEPRLEIPVRRAEAADPRFRWLGPKDRRKILGMTAAADLLILPSRMEGGANVLGEACRLGRPVLATRIPGSLGLLSGDHPGLFPAGDAEALAGLLARCLEDPPFLRELERRSLALAPRFDPKRERAAWTSLLAELR